MRAVLVKFYYILTHYVYVYLYIYYSSKAPTSNQVLKELEKMKNGIIKECTYVLNFLLIVGNHLLFLLYHFHQTYHMISQV